jgi:hypothetical protein
MAEAQERLRQIEERTKEAERGGALGQAQVRGGRARATPTGDPRQRRPGGGACS